MWRRHSDIPAGFMMPCMSCSGGHFNPVVSLSAYLCGGTELRLLPPYVVAQLSGGMLGAALTRVSRRRLCCWNNNKKIPVVMLPIKDALALFCSSGRLPRCRVRRRQRGRFRRRHQRCGGVHAGGGDDDRRSHLGGVHGGHQQPDPLRRGSILYRPHRDCQHICRVKKLKYVRRATLSLSLKFIAT